MLPVLARREDRRDLLCEPVCQMQQGGIKQKIGFSDDFLFPTAGVEEIIWIVFCGHKSPKNYKIYIVITNPRQDLRIAITKQILKTITL